MKKNKLHLTFIVSLIAITIALVVFYEIHIWMVDLKEKYYVEGNPQSFQTSYPFELFPYLLCGFIGLYVTVALVYIVSYKRKRFRQTKL